MPAVDANLATSCVCVHCAASILPAAHCCAASTLICNNAHMPCSQAAGQATGVGHADPSGSSAGRSNAQLQPHRAPLPPKAPPPAADRDHTQQKLQQAIALAMEQGLAAAAAGGGQPDALDQHQGAGSAQQAAPAGGQQQGKAEHNQLLNALLQALRMTQPWSQPVEFGEQEDPPQQQHTGAEAADAGVVTSADTSDAVVTPGLHAGLASPGGSYHLMPMEVQQGAPAGGLPGAAAGGGGHSSLQLGAAGAGSSSGAGPSSHHGAAGHQVSPGTAPVTAPLPTLEDQLSSLSVQVSIVIGSQKQCWCQPSEQGWLHHPQLYHGSACGTWVMAEMMFNCILLPCSGAARNTAQSTQGCWLLQLLQGCWYSNLLRHSQ